MNNQERVNRGCCCVIAAVVLATAPEVVVANHVEMNEGAASRLARYEPIGERLECLPLGVDALRKFYPIDNHHVIFFMDGGRIFYGETEASVRCRGLTNAKGYLLDIAGEHDLCVGDAIVGESGRGGAFSGSGKWQSGTSRRHGCTFMGFQEVTLPAKAE